MAPWEVALVAHSKSDSSLPSRGHQLYLLGGQNLSGQTHWGHSQIQWNKKSHKWWWLLIDSQVLVVFLVTTLFFCNFGIQSTARLDSSLGLIFLAGHQLIITVLNPSVWQQSHIYSRDMNHSQSCLHLLLPVTVCFLSVVIVAVPRNPHHTNSWGSDILAVRQKLNHCSSLIGFENVFSTTWVWVTLSSVWKAFFCCSCCEKQGQVPKASGNNKRHKK